MIYAFGEKFDFEDSEVICKEGERDSGCRCNGEFVLFRRKSDGMPWATLTYLPNCFGEQWQDVAVSHGVMELAKDTKKDRLIESCNDEVKRFLNLK